MTYKDALDRLFARLPMFSRIGAAAYKPGLERVIALSNFFDNPEKKFKSIHVGGTNGKGSTSHLIASALQEAGYRVGLYTSPHLVDFRERIKINGIMIPEDEVVRFVKYWQANAEQFSDKPSFFELTMMLAFNWFANQKVDYAVIEVGMGGCLDSTNIITPLLSVITNISKDHTQFLGNSLSEIAFEKAGIIKKGIPVVIGEAEGEVEQVFRNKAAEVGASIIEAYQDIDNQENDKFRKITPLRGDYQKWNINTARVSIQELESRIAGIDKNVIERGFQNVISNTMLMGRWMQIGNKPDVICDTGHNEAGIKYNMNQLSRMMAERPSATLRIVCGFVADKDIDNILPLFPKNAEYYLTQAQIPRALPVEKLSEKMQQFGFKSRQFSTVKDAYNKAFSEAAEQDIIFVGGSTFIVADFLSQQDKLT